MSDLIERMRSLEQDHAPDGWPAVQMRDLSALCDLVEAAGGQSVQPAVGPEVTDEMIEAGAQRLVAWEDGSVWPDSWSPMVVAAARNDAERVLRSALNAKPNHIADDSKMVVNLKPIAESKIRQLGGNVCGVLMRNEAGAWAAVSEGGRVMWLEGFEGRADETRATVMPREHGKNRYGLDMAYFRELFNRELNRPLVDFRPDELARVLARAARTADAAVLQEPEFQATRAHSGQGAEPVAWTWISGGRHVTADKPYADQLKADGLDVSALYTHPQPAQRSNQDDVMALLTNALANIRDTDASAKTLQSMAALALRASEEVCDE